MAEDKQNQMTPVTPRHFHTHILSSTLANDVQEAPATSSESKAIVQFEKAVNFLSVYYTMGLIVMGSACNLLSIAVLSRRTFRGTSMSVYLRFLSVMDLGTVLTGLTHFYLVAAYGSEGKRTVLSCRLNNWFTNTFLYSSSWTLISVTVERVLSIVKPHHVRILCSPSKAGVVLVFIVVTMGALNSPIFLIFGNMEVRNPVTNETYYRSCVIVADRVSMSLIFWWMDTMVSAFIPSFLLMVFNVVILKGVVNSRKNVEKVTGSSTGGVSVGSGPGSGSGSGSNPDSGGDKKGGKARRESSLTVTLLAINLTFVICNFPICAFALGPHYHTEEGLGRLGDALQGLLLMLMYTNNALNFWLYFITGSKFRNELFTLIKETFNKLKR